MRACLSSRPRAGRDIGRSKSVAQSGPVPAGRIRRYRTARRSSSLVPHTPASWPLSSAHCRHGVRAGHAAHTCLAWLIWSSAGPAFPTGKTAPDRCRGTRPDHAARAPVPGRAIREVPVPVIHRTTSVDVAGSDGWPHRCGGQAPAGLICRAGMARFARRAGAPRPGNPGPLPGDSGRAVPVLASAASRSLTRRFAAFRARSRQRGHLPPGKSR